MAVIKGISLHDARREMEEALSQEVTPFIRIGREETLYFISNLKKVAFVDCTKEIFEELSKSAK